ncbi:TRET1 protein, partial [Acromyrmex insinuator]
MNYGRRCTMIVCGVNFSLGWILIASSYNVIQLFIGRMLTGIAMGICAAYVGIYLAEISITSWKTVITIIPNIALITGILIVYLLGFVLQIYFFKKLCELYMFIFYTIDLITRINITIDPFLITVIVGIIQLVGIVITACCSKRIGRRTISIVSGFGSFGFFSIPWSMISEQYLTRYVNVLGQLTTFISLVGSYIIQSYPVMVTHDRNSLQLLLLYCIVVQSYATHEDGFTSTELKTKSEVSKGTTTSANTSIIDQNSNKSSQSDQGKDFFFSIGPKANPIGHIKISNNTFSELKEWLSKLLPINWENTKQDSLKEITPDNNDSSKETSDKILSDKTESPLHPKDDSPIGKRDLCLICKKISFYY